MPLIRYFVVASGMLLGLLFLANRCLPVSTVAVAGNDLDRPIIRIHSSQRWPDAIRFDTSAPIATTVPDAAPVPVPEPVRQAYAQEPSPPPPPQKRSTKIHHATHPRTASHHASRQRLANDERAGLPEWPQIGW
jgi:hypothetical protein